MRNKQSHTLKVKCHFELIHRYMSDESGATGIEYALIAAVVGIMGITSAGYIGESLRDTFSEIGEAFSDSSLQPTDRPFENSVG